MNIFLKKIIGLKHDNISYLIVISLFFGISISIPKINFIYILTVLALFIGYKGFTKFSKPALLDYYYALFFTWSAISLLWSESLVQGLQQTVFICITFVLVHFSSNVFSRHGALPKLFQLLFILLCLHLTLSIFEILTLIKWPISSFSKYSYLFGRPSYYTDTIPKYILQYPTSFFWAVNESGFFSMLALPFIFLLKNRFAQFFLITCILTVINFSMSRTYIFFAPLISYSAIFMIALVDFKALPFIKFLSKTLISILIVFASVKSGEMLFKKYSLARNLKYETRISYYIVCGYFNNAYNLKLDCGEADDNGPDGQDDSSNLVPESQIYNERASINKGIWDNTPSWNPFGLGGGSLKNRYYTYENTPKKIVGPHHYWLEIYSEYGLFFLMITIAYFFWIFKKLFFAYRKMTDLRFKYLTGILIVTLPFFILGAIILHSLFFFFEGIIYFIIMHSVVKIINAGAENSKATVTK